MGVEGSSAAFLGDAEALEHELGENGVEGLVDLGEMIIDLELAAAVLEIGEIGLEGGEVGVANDGGIGDEIGPGFEVDEASGPSEIERELLGVEEVKDGHIVFIEVEMFEGIEEGGDIGEEITDDDDESALADAFGEVVESLDDLGFASGLDIGEATLELAQVGWGASRGEIDGFFGEASEADGITLVDKEMGDRAREASGVIEAGAGGWVTGELHRGGGIDDEIAAEIGIGFELADEELIGATEDAPVEVFDVIAWGILPIFGEFDGGAAGSGAVLAVDVAEHGVADMEHQLGEARNGPMIEEVGFAHGLRSWGRIFVGMRGSLDGFLDHPADDFHAGDAFAFGVEVDENAVSENGFGDGVNIFEASEIASLENGAGFGAEDEVLDGARAGAPHHPFFDPVWGFLASGSAFADEFDDMFVDVFGDGDASDDFLEAKDIGGVENFLEDGHGATSGGFGDLEFFFGGGVADIDEEHEAIELGFWEWVGAFLFDGILGSEDEERFFEGEAMFTGVDLLLLHGLEESGLGFGWGAVNFVGENDIGEDGAFDEFESAATWLIGFLEDFRAGDVTGHEIWGELDAIEVEGHQVGEGVNEEGFGEAWDAHEEGVTAGEDAGEELFDDRVLADDNFPEFGTDPAIEFAEFIDSGDIGFLFGVGVWSLHRWNRGRWRWVEKIQRGTDEIQRESVTEEAREMFTVKVRLIGVEENGEEKKSKSKSELEQNFLEAV